LTFALRSPKERAVAVREEGFARTGIGVAVGTREMWVAAAIALSAGALLAIRLDVPAFYDNEARYAEVAREMLLRRDYVSPYMDGTLFLNKPPLVFWLSALVFEIAGPTEWARLVTIAAAVAAVYATCRLGTLLYGAGTGLVAGVALATSIGFGLEARTLRPDMILLAVVVAALLCWRRAEDGRSRRTAWLAGMYAALGVGVLAKGLVPVIVTGIPIAALTLGEHGLRGIWRLRPGLGLAVMGLVVLPWHVLVAREHPGFAWDYVVNQHILFFLDRKLPRDSEGDPLTGFLIAFAGRATPWVLALPLTLAEAVRGMSPRAPREARSTFLLWAWAGGLLLFFACAPSRLEHYSIPALPAVALLAARAWQRADTGELPSGLWRAGAVLGVVAAAVGIGALAVGRPLLEQTYWIAGTPALLALVVPAGLVLAATGIAVALAAARRRATAVVAAVALGMVPMLAIVLRAQAVAEEVFSWRPVARALVAAVGPETEIVFEAPTEYQLVGGLAYYTERPIAMLEPPGFVPPTYLEPHVAKMFLSRADFERRWRAGEPLAFVSDPLQHREDPSGLVPGRYRVLGRFGDRWVLINQVAAAPS
jgi:4-amino-4-deoxy-L-arabinose transferase-like glycosyltransferase